MRLESKRIGREMDGTTHFVIEPVFGDVFEDFRDEIAESFADKKSIELRYKTSRGQDLLVEYDGSPRGAVSIGFGFPLAEPEQTYKNPHLNPYESDMHYGLKAKDVVDLLVISATALEDGVNPNQIVKALSAVLGERRVKGSYLKYLIANEISVRRYLPTDYSP